MTIDSFTLTGDSIRLDPLGPDHAAGMVAAAAEDPSLYCWTFVPHDMDAAATYIDTALEWQRAGTAVPFAILRTADGTVIGSTRYFKIEHFEWPDGHERHGRSIPTCAKSATRGSPARPSAPAPTPRQST